MKKKILLFIALMFLLAMDSYPLPSKTNRYLSTVYIYDAPGSTNKVPVDLYLPQPKPRGTILVLPGWNFSRKRWHQQTGLLSMCRDHNIAAIFPEMKVTNYESRYFPETTLKWGPLPGGKWVKEVLIPYIQKKYGLLRKGNNNFLLGLSTGGHGVLVVSMQNSGLFTGGAALSADYNQLDMPWDKITTRIYGPVTEFHSRWKNIDNPEEWVKKGNCPMPLYIGHGKEDKVIPVNQSISFYKTVKKHCPGLPIVLHVQPEAGHTFSYWKSELPRIFQFYESLIKQ